MSFQGLLGLRARGPYVAAEGGQEGEIMFGTVEGILVVDDWVDEDEAGEQAWMHHGDRHPVYRQVFEG